MAIETKKIIEISTAGAVTSVRELKDEINSLRDAWLNAEEGTEEYENITNQLIEDQKKLNDVMRIGKNEASAATGSYNSLVNQMAALKTAWRSTTSEVQRSQLGDKIRAINDTLKEYDASIGNHQRKVGSYEQALQALTATYDSQKQELAALKTALDNLEPGTDAYNQAFERATEITHNLQERQQELRMSANDLGTQLSNVASISAGIVGAFNSVNAIMSLTGSKSEDVQKAMLKVQQSMALVQGLKGLEGAIKSLKSYVTWAAKTYDRIVDWVSGNRTLTKAIQETTVATEANQAANDANAAAETKATAGATSLSAGMTGVAGSTTVATTAMKAFKAAIISSGIGILVVALGTLVAKMIEAANVAHSLDDIAKQRATNYNELLEKWDDEAATRHQRKIDAMKAEGKSQSEIFAEEMRYHEQMRDKYEKEREAMVDLQGVLDDYVKKTTNIPVYNVEVGITTKQGKEFNNKNVKAALRDVNFKQALIDAGIDGTTISSIMEDPISYLEGRLNKFTDDTVSDMRYWSDDMVRDFNRIKEEGIQSFEDLSVAAKIYGQALQQYKDDYEFDPLEGIVEDYGNQARQAVAEANGIMESEIAAENRMHQERLKNVQDYNEKVDEYNRETAEKRLNREKKEKIDTQQLENAHRKKVWDIITGATQSIIDGAKSANQKELANLKDAQAKELAELAKYGQLKRKIVIADEEGNTKTVTAEEAIRTKYAKQMAEVRLKYQISAADQAVAKIRDGAHEARNLYDQLTAAGVKDGETLKQAHTDAVEEAYEYTHSALTETKNQYEVIYNEIKDDEKISAEQRLEIWQKYEDAKADLEEAETKHTLDQIKIRKDALIAEIDEVTKKLDEEKNKRTKINAESDKDKATGWGGFWNVFAGGAQNPSFEKQQQEVEIKFNMDIQALEDQIAIYQRTIDDLNVTDAERTAAMEKQSELRKEIMKLEADKAVESAKIQIDKQKELISTIVDVGNSIGDILGSVADAWEANVKAQLAAGKISQEEADKQLENMRALQITQAIINTIAGSIGAFTQASQTIPPPYGQIVGAAAAAAVLAAGYAQIAQIKAANKDSNISSTTQMSPTMPTVSDFNPNYVTNTTGKDDTEYLNELFSRQKLFVSVTDINSTQARVKTTEEESSF